jgi:hypothetical protein
MPWWKRELPNTKPLHSLKKLKFNLEAIPLNPRTDTKSLPSIRPLISTSQKHFKLLLTLAIGRDPFRCHHRYLHKHKQLSRWCFLTEKFCHLPAIRESAPKYKTFEAMRIKGSNIEALGRSKDLLKGTEPGTLRVDLKGKTVIPGLIDSHLHGIRAALSFSTEVHWIGVTSIETHWRN